MSQKDPSKRPKQTPWRAVASLNIFLEISGFFAFLGTKKGCCDGNFIGFVWEGTCNEKTWRIHFLVGHSKNHHWCYLKNSPWGKTFGDLPLPPPSNLTPFGSRRTTWDVQNFGKLKMKCYMPNTWLTFHRDGEASITYEKLCLSFVNMPLWQVFDLYNSPPIKSDICWNFMWHVPSCVLLIDWPLKFWQGQNKCFAKLISKLFGAVAACCLYFYILNIWESTLFKSWWYLYGRKKYVWYLSTTFL